MIKAMHVCHDVQVYECVDNVCACEEFFIYIFYCIFLVTFFMHEGPQTFYGSNTVLDIWY